jgi:DNA-binding LacI/PurR family transcriptional regulator
VTDLLALGFMDAARRSFALTIPDEICVIGFDDIPEAGWDSYNLTTFRQPVDEIVRWVGSVLENTSAGEPVAQSTLLQAEPVWRQSVRPR